jgi:hypothetical protein
MDASSTNISIDALVRVIDAIMLSIVLCAYKPPWLSGTSPRGVAALASRIPFMTTKSRSVHLGFCPYLVRTMA